MILDHDRSRSSMKNKKKDKEGNNITSRKPEMKHSISQDEESGVNTNDNGMAHKLITQDYEQQRPNLQRFFNNAQLQQAMDLLKSLSSIKTLSDFDVT